ncbi:protein ALP1-like [Diprion similis]|uniref:protein ALP1-like n=1 Tax=Diprion similis TaxID=362088 RepID=UPI001EF7AF1B|nr:protein ALP1-like [Diprion similis]
MDSDNEIDTLIVILSIALWLRTRPRQWGVRPIYRLRREQGEYWNLFCEIKRGDPQQFFKYTRMDCAKFDELLEILKPHLKERSMRTTLIPEERLALTLRYLATGDQTHSIAWGFRVGRSTARQIILETCEAIWIALSTIYLPQKTPQDWYEIGKDFLEIWNLPNCVGAIDGKHIAIQSPPNSGSLYFSYKKSHSIVLMAACDAKYKFTMANVGALGSDNDAGIFGKTEFGKALLNGQLNLPPDTQLPNSNVTFPHFFVGDEAFPLYKSLMRPYPGRQLTQEKSIFN